ncbi:hypothetical protein, partial [Psychrobacter sp. TB20-MNA-CIBAN-0197]
DMATFDSTCSRLKTLLQNNVSLVTDKRAHDKQAKKLQTDFDKLITQQNLDQPRIQQQRKALTDLQQQQAALIQSQPITNMRSEQEQVDQINTQIE